MLTPQNLDGPRWGKIPASRYALPPCDDSGKELLHVGRISNPASEFAALLAFMMKALPRFRMTEQRNLSASFAGSDPGADKDEI